MTTNNPVAVEVTEPVTLEPFPDSRVQTIAALGAVAGLLVALVLVGVGMVTKADLPGEFWPVLGTLAGAPLLLLTRR
jgi:hypothetical protein